MSLVPFGAVLFAIFKRPWVDAALFLCLPVALAQGAANHYVRGTCTNPVSPYVSWATAATNVQDAVVSAVDGDTVWVTNGTYGVTSQISVTNGITLRSVRTDNSVTILTRIGSNTVCRVLSVQHAGAVVSGFTIQNGFAIGNGGGVQLSAGLLSNCVVTANISTLLGGGVYCDTNGRVANCSISANIGSGGGGLYLYGGTAQNCDLSANYAIALGGGAVCLNGGLLRNSCIHANGSLLELAFTQMGGGVYCQDTGTVESCTIADNAASLEGGGLYSAGSNGMVRNTIIYRNRTGRNDPNYSSSGGGWTFGWCCADPLLAGTNNTAADPQFMSGSDYHLVAGSPCIGKGTNQAWMIGALDMGGQPRIMGTNVDLGAYEFDPQAFSCNFTMDRTQGMAPLKVVFRASLSGSNTKIQSGLVYHGVTWTFSKPHFPYNSYVKGDDASYLVVTNTFADPDTYTVTLAVRNTSLVTATAEKDDCLRAGTAAVYVSPNGNDLLNHPYTNWASAAGSVQAAVDAAVDGSTVWVTNGTYNLMASITVSGLTYTVSNPIQIQDAVTVRSVAGAEQTVINNAGGSRCFWIGNTGAVVQGFTVQGGTADQGGGIYALAGRVQNCIVRNNAATTGGGGLYCGPQASARNCLVYENLSAFYGGGVWNEGALVNCTVASNLATVGGGVYNAVTSSSLTNTIIYGNNVASNLTGGSVTNWFNYALTSFSWTNSLITNLLYYALTSFSWTNSLIDASSIVPTGAQYYGTATFSHCCASPVAAGVSNMDANPRFVFPPAGVYRLYSNSPCVNAGINQNWMTNAVDLAGNARRYTNGVVDLGAYEWVPPLPLLLIYNANPSNTDILYKYGTNLTCSVLGAVTNGGARYFNLGWSVTGNVNSNGPGTSVTVIQKGDSTLTWAWSTQFFFSAVASDTNRGYVVGDTNGWYDAGAVLEVTGVPTNYYHVGLWWGYGVGGDDLVLTNTQPRNLIAVFAPIMTSNGTPEVWLVSHGLTNPTFEAADQADVDHDGAPAWAEYRAGTDPTNPASVFTVRSLAPSANGAVVQWNSVSGKVYRLVASTNVMSLFLPVGPVGGFAGTPPVNTFTDTTATGTAILYYGVMTY